MGANEPGQPPLSGTGRANWSVDLPVPFSALAVGAHPDDVEFGCGATLAKWATEGCVVHHLVLTDGSKGTWNPDADVRALVAAREVEQRTAARALGATGEVAFLHRVDGDLVADRELCSEVALWIRRLRPDVVLGHDPWKRYRLHPDHRAAGFVTCDAVVAARDPHFFREHGVAHHRPRAMLLWEADEPNHAETVGEPAMAAKLAALEAHRSQFESTMKVVDPAQLDEFRTRIRTRLVANGQAVRHPAAELFALISDL